jgi:hypothetical protein
VRVTVRLVNQDQYDIGHVPDDDAAAIVEEFQTGSEPVLSFILDDTSIVHLARLHIVSVELAQELPAP